MAFEYHSENGITLTKSQEVLLETIENLPFPFGSSITKLKDLRKKAYLKVVVTGQKEIIGSCNDYIEQYNTRHSLFFGGKHFEASQRHQGEIGDRFHFVNLQLINDRSPLDNFQPILGLYSRIHRWWTGMHWQKVGLVLDNIKEYARQQDISEDIVLGFVFIQQMMHAYYDVINGKGFPSMIPLEYTFAEFGMLSFIDRSPDIRFLFPDARYYTATRIGTRPEGFGFGIELFERAGNKAIWMINRYRDISNWTEPYALSKRYDNSFIESQKRYYDDPNNENAEKYFNDILGVLNIDWKEPLDPIQPAIGERWDFDR